MGNRMKAPVEGIKTCYLILNIRHHFDLLRISYIPSIFRNLVSSSKLNVARYSFNFGNGYFNLFKYRHLIGFGILCDRLYQLNPDNLYAKMLLTLQHNVGTKCNLVNEHSTYL